jgi:nucleoside triphosphate diphosphatase
MLVMQEDHKSSGSKPRTPAAQAPASIPSTQIRSEKDSPGKRSTPAEAFSELLRIMDQLRDPGGCPWDREQTFASLRPYLVEEAAEALEALDAGDLPHFSEELGDLMLQIVFHARLGREAGAFDIVDVLQGISAKMIRRHPHVFAETQVADAAEVRLNWAALKAAESPGPKHPLGRIPPALSALYKAQKTGDKAGAAHFDWPNAQAVLEKVREEVAELEAELEGGTREAVEDEFGDVLFSLTQLARHLHLDADRALDRAVEKFRTRFVALDALLAAEGRSLAEMDDAEKEAAWQAAKRSLKTRP